MKADLLSLKLAFDVNAAKYGFKIRILMIRTLVLVALGGGIGSVLRYLVSKIVYKWFSAYIPMGTFAVNVLGCFMIGLFFGLAIKNASYQGDMRILLMTGLCGGFTTFSAFALENVNLLQSGEYMQALIYIVASVVVGLLAVFGGIVLVR